jgi:hypothetical protein
VSSGGIAVVLLSELPGIDQFDLAAYSNVAAHRHKPPEGLNIQKIKADVRTTWAATGFERLIKILPVIHHNPNKDPDIQYPPGQGAPQWLAKVSLRARIVAIIADYPNGGYIAADVARL